MWQRTPLFLLALLAFAALLVPRVTPVATSNESKEMKVGTVDLATLFRGYNRVKDQQVELQKLFQQQAGELRQKQQEIETRVKTIQNLPDERREVTEKEIQDSIYQLDFESKWAQRSMTLDTNQMTWSIYIEVLEEVEKYARANGYTLVVKSDSAELEPDANVDAMKFIGARQVLFHGSENDLTQPLLRILNQKHARRKK